MESGYGSVGIVFLLLLVSTVVGGIGEFVIRRARRREAERIEAETIRGIREYQELSKSPDDRPLRQL